MAPYGRQPPKVPQSEVLARLAARGIDLEASYTAFLAEVRIHPPPELLRTLAAFEVQHGITGYLRGCDCQTCLDARRDAKRRSRAAKRAKPG